MIKFDESQIKLIKSMSIIDKTCQNLHFNDKNSILIDNLRFSFSPKSIFEPLLMK